MPPAYPCPACGSLVLADTPGSYQLCSVCDWEDDAVQLANPTTGGGANRCSLVEAQASPRDHAPGVPRDPAWRPVSEQEIAWHRAECVTAGTPFPNPATDVYYWRHPFERVYSTPDWYDGPVSGVADYQGRPYRFSRRWAGRDEPEIYDLAPVSERERDLEVQLWALWVRWREAFDAGRTPPATHPCLPEDLDARRALEEELAGIAPSTGASLVATATFVGNTISGTDGRVRWVAVGDADRRAR